VKSLCLIENTVSLDIKIGVKNASNSGTRRGPRKVWEAHGQSKWRPPVRFRGVLTVA